MSAESGNMSMLDHIKHQIDSGLSVRKYCDAHELKEHTFRYWKARQDKNESRGHFKLVEGNKWTVNPNPMMKLVYPNQIELLIYSEMSPYYLRQLMTC